MTWGHAGYKSKFIRKKIRVNHEINSNRTTKNRQKAYKTFR